MLDFLNTAVLAAAAAAIFPFLLHLFSRRKVRVIPFSSVALLKAMQKRQVRAIKIKQLLLLIIRTLIILTVVLAFARPATRGGYLGSHATVSAAIVIDNSASMGLSVKDGRLFDLAIRKARNILNQLGQSDEAAVIVTSGDFSQTQSNDIFGNPAAAAAFLDQIGLTDNRADLTESLNQAAGLLTERKNLNREIYLISDFQQNSFDPEKARPAFDGRVYLVDLPTDDVDNSSITGVDLGNQLIEIGTEFMVTTTVKKQSGSGGDEMLVSLYIDDKRVAQKDIQLKPGETGTVSFPVVVADPGYHSGYAALSDDDLLADNSHYFAFYIPETFSILVVGEEGLDRRLFELALAPDENLRRHWSVQSIPYNMFSSASLNQYDVVMLVDYRSLSGGDAARVRDFAKKGGGLLVNLGRDSDSADYNASLVDLTGIQLISSFPKQYSRSGYYLMTDFDLDHQILSIFKSPDSKAGYEFRSYARAKAGIMDEGRVHLLARYSDGSPAISVADYDRGKVMLLNCDITPDISDLSLHPFFVPFVVRSCEYLSSDFSSQAETYSAGSTPVRSLRRAFNVKNEFVLVTPDGQRRLLPGRMRGDLNTVECGRLEHDGIYSIFNDAAESDRFAVNISPEEGDLYRGDWKEITAGFAEAEQIPYSADLAGFIAQKRFGRELWHYFAAAAILLLALEMLIARDRGAPLPTEE